jgi:hypothetical protein
MIYTLLATGLTENDQINIKRKLHVDEVLKRKKNKPRSKKLLRLFHNLLCINCNTAGNF